MHLIKLLPYLGVSLAFACGGEGDGNGTSSDNGSIAVNSGVDDSKPLSRLTDAELQQIGESYADAQLSESVIDVGCKFTALLLSAGSSDPNAAPTPAQVQTCNDAVTKCRAEAQSMPPEIMINTEVPTSSAAFAGCSVTVGQYETCLTASLNLLKDLFGSLSCETRSTPSSTAAPTLPRACMELASRCSGALGE